MPMLCSTLSRSQRHDYAASFALLASALLRPAFGDLPLGLEPIAFAPIVLAHLIPPNSPHPRRVIDLFQKTPTSGISAQTTARRGASPGRRRRSRRRPGLDASEQLAGASSEAFRENGHGSMLPNPPRAVKLARRRKVECR